MVTISCDREFFPACSRCKAVEAEVSNAVHHGTADLYYSPEVEQNLVIDLILSQQFGVIAGIAQKQVQLPHCPERAIEAPRYESAGQMFGLEHGEGDFVIRFLL